MQYKSTKTLFACPKRGSNIISAYASINVIIALRLKEVRTCYKPTWTLWVYQVSVYQTSVQTGCSSVVYDRDLHFGVKGHYYGYVGGPGKSAAVAEIASQRGAGPFIQSPLEVGAL